MGKIPEGVGNFLGGAAGLAMIPAACIGGIAGFGLIGDLMIKEGCHGLDAMDKIVFAIDDLVPGKSRFDHPKKSACELQNELQDDRLHSQETTERHGLSHASASVHPATMGSLALVASRDDIGRFTFRPAEAP